MTLSKFVLDQSPAARWTDDCQGKKDYDGAVGEDQYALLAARRRVSRFRSWHRRPKA